MASAIRKNTRDLDMGWPGAAGMDSEARIIPQDTTFVRRMVTYTGVSDTITTILTIMATLSTTTILAAWSTEDT
jgi:hypothetical protein